ncbi:T6SS immunity protein Tli4 family protein [Burkholderia gladioli]|uniref:T6SS immunity protein Tli4 family protein n=1 Tax=Burkholderia gladioli TaxID=28095 RepID=UPI00163F0184|nr:T6SS immunity protein Tli4 family protein [Burkholderia gladioli]MBU9214806.1 hypothetical protein [Burkholderia gladioli]MDN7723353.1 T6SS immunity protein Tli4 family protein [Burkholderia gladioli]MDN7803498.1 T6SS immunity protein Tli4 family protein [Burkholderia gladioli]
MKVASTFATCLVAVALATLAGCNHQQDANTSSSLRPTSESMRTVCVGRYTVDLPRSADHFKMAQSFNGIRIDARSPSNAQQLHEAILQAAPVDASMATGSLSSPPIDMPDGGVFQLSNDGEDLHTLRAYILKQDVAFSFSVQVLSDSVAGAKVAIAKLMQSVRPRHNLETPTEPGFCIDNGFIPGAPSDLESVYLIGDLPESKSGFGIGTDTASRGTQKNIIERLSSLPPALANLVSSSSKTLRSRSWNVAGRDGDEHDVVDRSASTASFEWTAMPGEDRARDPWIDIKLDSDGPVSESEQNQLLVVWDEILNSLKWR